MSVMTNSHRLPSAWLCALICMIYSWKNVFIPQGGLICKMYYLSWVLWSESDIPLNLMMLICEFLKGLHLCVHKSAAFSHKTWKDHRIKAENFMHFLLSQTRGLIQFRKCNCCYAVLCRPPPTDPPIWPPSARPCVHVHNCATEGLKLSFAYYVPPFQWAGSFWFMTTL